MRIRLVIALLFLASCYTIAQDEQMSTFIENIVEQTVSSDEDADIESIVSDLEILYRNPININNASAADFERLWILNDFQIASLLDYRKQMRRIVSVHELRYVFGFNDRLVDLITPFIVCGSTEKRQPESLKQTLKRSSHEIMLRTSYRSTSDNNYLGSALQQYSKYSGHFGNHIRIGFIGEKDAGEQFANGVNNLGYDFYSGYAQYESENLLQQVILGDYRVRLGQGLLIWNGYSSGKSSEITSVQKRGQGISPNSSKDEYNYLRGAAVKLGNKNFQFTLWSSFKQIDGSIDTLSDGIVLRTVSTSGYHRTANETLRKNNTDLLNYGASVNYKSLRVHAGINWMHSEYSIPFQPEDDAYKRFAFEGETLEGLSADYKVLLQRTQFYGEAAYSNNGIAALTGINLMPASSFTTNVFYRYYQPEYYSPFANGMVESGDMNNETGLFGGFKWITDWKFTLSAYTDVFSIPWYSFTANAPTNGSDYLVELNYRPTRTFELIARYKNKEKEKNYKDSEQNSTKILPFKKESLRISARYLLSEKISMSSRFEWATSSFDGQSPSTGHLVFQDIAYSISQNSSVKLRYAQFNIEDYDSRIYAYESDVLYAYSIPAYYGNGQKVYCLYRQKIGNSLTVWLRYSHTSPFENTPQQKSEFRGQVQIKF